MKIRFPSSERASALKDLQREIERSYRKGYAQGYSQALDDLADACIASKHYQVKAWARQILGDWRYMMKPFRKSYEPPPIFSALNVTSMVRPFDEIDRET